MTLLGTWHKYDESFTLNGVVYPMLFPESGGPLGFGSSTPFAPKSTTGERRYFDYDPWSYVSLDDFSGGMGQERLIDVTKYYRARNLDARGGDLILGPLVTEFGLNGLTPDDEEYLTNEDAKFPAKLTTTGTKLARRILIPADVTSIQFLWIPMASVHASLITVKVYSDSGGLPNAQVATMTVYKYNTAANYLTWTACDFDTAFAVTPGAYYWVSIEGTTSTLYWASENDAAITGECAQYISSWAALAAYRPIVSFNGANQAAVMDYPPLYRYGYGEDGIERMWMLAGHKVFYMGYDGVTPAAVLAPTTIKDLPNYIADALWWQGSGDAHPYLYVALWDADDMQKFDGNVGTEQWATQTGIQARKLCAHNDILWRCDTLCEVSGSLSGDGDPLDWGTAVVVGGKTRPLRNMVSWNGNLWCGKEDGIYLIEYPTGYPTTGIPTATLIVDLSAMAYAPNCTTLVVHQGDLYFNVLNGLLKYTANGVLTSVTPESGPDMPVSDRTIFRAAASTVNTLYVCAEGVAGAPSSLLAYQEGAWHPIVTSPRLGDLMRSVAVDPGSYGSFPRVWFDMGLAGAYVEMPLTTNRRWTWDADSENRMTYAEEGWIELSRIDGNLAVVDKDWQSIRLDISNVYTGDPQPVKVYWRTVQGGGWTEVASDIGMIIEGVNVFTLPAGTWGKWLDLRIWLGRTLWPDASGYYKSPRVKAIVLKYMERPQDLKAFTRTYAWGTEQVWRDGAPVDLSYGEWLTQLETLRESAEPLSFEHLSGNTYLVHIIKYDGSEPLERRVDGRDYLSAVVTVQLQVVE
jgi:hypothetical protein